MPAPHVPNSRFEIGILGGNSRKFSILDDIIASAVTDFLGQNKKVPTNWFTGKSHHLYLNFGALFARRRPSAS